MNQYEWGVVFYLEVSFDLTANTALSLVFTKPDGVVMTRSKPQVAVGLTTLASSLGSLGAGTYVVYTFAVGEVDQSGVWTARLTYTDVARSLISDPATFTVAA